jgi:hypothetical protein
VNLATLALIALVAQELPSAEDVEAKRQAQALLSAGAALYEAGDYAGALDRFTAAYAQYPSPKLWLNIGQAQRDLGRPLQALEAFERFVAEAGNARPEDLVEAHRAVAELQAQLGRVVVDCKPSGADVIVDGRAIGRMPLARPLWVTPGAHEVTVKRRNYFPATFTVEVTPGEARRLSFRLRAVEVSVASLPAPAPALRLESPGPAAAEQQQPLYARWPFWAVVGGAVLLGGIVFAATAGHGDVPSTPLGTQKAF